MLSLLGSFSPPLKYSRTSLEHHPSETRQGLLYREPEDRLTLQEDADHGITLDIGCGSFLQEDVGLQCYIN